ncbi:MAG: MFS transporter [Candidatus Sericytochromatia bacterium]|nr:MFS transporter [Candidatus Sericytochromatia bacterium]
MTVEDAAAAGLPARPPRRSLRAALGVLRPGPFRRYMVGEACSTTGTWMQVMAEGWVMTSLTASELLLGTVSFATGLPMLLLGMAGGALADRVSRRRIVLVCQAAQFALASTLGWLVWTGAIQVWHVVAVAACAGVVNAFEMPAASSLLPELVEPHEIQDAYAVDRSSFHLTRLLGPALAGVAIAAFGPAVAFFANALSFLPLMVALRTLPEPRPGAEGEAPEPPGGIGAGLAWVRQDPPTAAMVGVMALLTAFPMPVMLVLLPLYARHLGLDALGMGLLMSVNAAGALLGSILLLRVERHERPLVMAAAALGVGGGLAGLAQLHWAPASAAVLFGLSVCLATTFGLTNTTIQERVAGHLRGRVSAVTQLVFFGGQPFAALGMAALAEAIGMGAAFVTAGGCYALGSLALLAGPGRRAGAAPAGPAAPDAEAA